MMLPEGMHPLVAQVSRDILAGRPVADTLEGDLLALDGESLRDAVRELIYLATIVEEVGHPELSAPIFELVESRPIITMLDRANAVRLAIGGESIVLAAKKFARFSAAADATRRARAKPGERKGKGKTLKDLGKQRFAGLRLR